MTELIPANDVSVIIDDMSRVLRQLKVVAGDPLAPLASLLPHGTEADDQDREVVTFAAAIYAARRQREKALPGLTQLCQDPVWDIALDLFVSTARNLEISVSSACVAAAAPMTTGLRALNLMIERGMVLACADPCDGRRRLVTLSPKMMEEMKGYFGGLIGKRRCIDS